jgi:hypothetical protein
LEQSRAVALTAEAKNDITLSDGFIEDNSLGNGEAPIRSQAGSAALAAGVRS